ncbi:MAG: hypothetical protein A3I73_00905 [Omnitrophica bacterium RIFCSPLOWO2_02_FULL_45_16]|nr:MAG: hypothetical protein A3C51_04335 [Omnitrophica bacterium RIFCSPHIGHO2_02_FULL_46_20]OGX00764.1 MAG: hypothetical protein A3I73_00905 [Omnitrophica bacterium RIFCSPLOWO2_02_FULL_45_16]
MKKILAILIILLITSPLLAKYENFSIYTNGFRWIEYSKEEKLLYIGFIYGKFNIDANKYPAKKIMDTLDHLYDLARKDKKDDELDKLLVLPCSVVLSGFIDPLKEEAEKYRIKK